MIDENYKIEFNKFYLHKIKAYILEQIYANEQHKNELIELYYDLLLSVAKNEVSRTKINTFYQEVLMVLDV